MILPRLLHVYVKQTSIATYSHAEMHALMSIHSDAEGRVAALQLAKTQLEADLSKTMGELEDATTMYERLSAEHQEASAKAASVEAILRARVQELQGSLQAALADVKEKDAEKANAALELEELRTAMEATQQGLEDKELELIAANAKVGKLEECVDETEETYLETLSKLQSLEQRHSKTLRALNEAEDALKVSQAEVTSTTEQNASASAQIESLTAKVNELDSLIAELQQQLSTTTTSADKTTVHQEYERLVAENTRFKQKQAKISDMLDASEQQRQQKNAEIAQLKQELAQQGEALEASRALTKELSDANATIASMKEQVHQIQAVADAEKARADKVQEQFESQTELVELRETVKMLTEELAIQSGLRNTAESRLEELEAENVVNAHDAEKVVNELARMKESLDALYTRHDSVKQEKESLQQKAQRLEQELERSRDELAGVVGHSNPHQRISAMCSLRQHCNELIAVRPAWKPCDCLNASHAPIAFLLCHMR
eukprot:m.122491 g.122491  ORF g.122491 m.122491 type:complete len:493 (+) comp13733_c1_seq3:99-1577(+)